uniref:Transposase MuDR plant domain-containing protein n=2 Tax=Aegilops tauschii subsp. strangulata TaxID=200361 RepID=A0A453RM32_AEGTS
SFSFMYRMDPNSCYVLKIRLLGNPKKARKEAMCFYFEKVIDSDLTNYEDLVESIIVQYQPRYLEVAHVHYYDEVLKTFPEIKSDQELMYMFEKHAKSKMVQMFIVYWEPSEPYEPIIEYYSDVHIQPKNNVDQDDDSYLRNPIPENEHVGIDEENIYLKEEPKALNVVLLPDKEKDQDYVVDGESEDESEDGSEDESEDETEVEEDEELHEVNHAPNIEYDKDDPPMTEGFIYPNMKEFKLALSQHAIKHEFEYNTEKSAPCRFRGYCKRRDEDNCPWRIHASTTDDFCTVVVKKPFGHDSSSARRKKKVKNATKYWIVRR